MTPIDYIRRGIINKNWDDVANGFASITGEHIKLLEKNDSLIELRLLVNQILDIIYPKVVLSDNQYNNESIPQESSFEDDDKIIDHHKITAMSGQSNGIQFVTNKPTQQDVEINKEKAAKAIKLSRAAPRKYDVKCNECDEIFESNRPDGEIGQKCPKCLKNKMIN